jgi:hypothetical protein
MTNNYGVDWQALRSQPNESYRCAWCGWPLYDSPDKGCVRGSCSQRPLPDHLQDRARALEEAHSLIATDYILTHYPSPQPAKSPTEIQQALHEMGKIECASFEQARLLRDQIDKVRELLRGSHD